jgi:hypothetical protein
MQIRRFQAQGSKDKPACCGNAVGGVVHLILDRPVSMELLSRILATGQYAAVDYQTKAGILYVESKVLVVSGPFGRDRLQIRCKLGNARVEECNRHIATITELLEAIE